MSMNQPECQEEADYYTQQQEEEPMKTIPFGDEVRKITHLRFEGRPSIIATPEKPIEPFLVNGEMAHMTWFRFGELEFNGKYVTEIGYESSLDKPVTKKD